MLLDALNATPATFFLAPRLFCHSSISTASPSWTVEDSDFRNEGDIIIFFFPNEKDLNKYENSILTYYDVKKINLKEHIPFKLI